VIALIEGKDLKTASQPLRHGMPVVQ
jgi:hypothetical protein